MTGYTKKIMLIHHQVESEVNGEIYICEILVTMQKKPKYRNLLVKFVML